MKKTSLFFPITLALLISCGITGAQTNTFTHADSLRGGISKERSWWDLTYYHLNIRVNPSDSTIIGTNLIRYRVLSPYQVMQVDLQAPMKITGFAQNGTALKYRRDGNAYFVELAGEQRIGAVNDLTVSFGGRPQISRRPPWSGGITWKKDKAGKPVVVSTCQGAGASLWWPCKEHQYDEPDSMLISVTVPEGVMDVSNGRLRKTELNGDGTATYHWFVSSPINNYCVNINIADYESFTDAYHGEKGDLDCSFYLLKEDFEKGKPYFLSEYKRTLESLEHWFGPYPFYSDGYKLVQVPYPGMEHQSSVTYGNGFKFGYGGRDESRSGWGMKFDFIIEHESSHEWFGNSITAQDIADMWIHEGFGAYSEALFTEYYYGKKAGAEYVTGTRRNIRNTSPIVGTFNVNDEGSGDMYSKGANMLHTIRQLVNNDEKWRGILRGIQKTFYHKTVAGDQIKNYIAAESGLDLDGFFRQYLNTTQIPEFQYKQEGSVLKYRWSNVVDNFKMNLKITVSGKEVWLKPSAEWQEIKTAENARIETDGNFYVTYTDIAAAK